MVKDTKCPKCGSDRLYKTGFHYLQAGPAQRWLCRTCGFRFSEKSIWACKDCGICFPQGKPGNNCPTCGHELTCLTTVKHTKPLAEETEKKFTQRDVEMGEAALKLENYLEKLTRKYRLTEAELLGVMFAAKKLFGNIGPSV